MYIYILKCEYILIVHSIAHLTVQHQILALHIPLIHPHKVLLYRAINMQLIHTVNNNKLQNDFADYISVEMQVVNTRNKDRDVPKSMCIHICS